MGEILQMALPGLGLVLFVAVLALAIGSRAEGLTFRDGLGRFLAARSAQTSLCFVLMAVFIWGVSSFARTASARLPFHAFMALVAITITALWLIARAIDRKRSGWP